MLAIAISVAFGQKSYTFKVLAAKGSNQTYTQNQTRRKEWYPYGMLGGGL